MRIEYIDMRERRLQRGKRLPKLAHRIAFIIAGVVIAGLILFAGGF